LRLGLGEGREVVDLLLALAAEAHVAVALQLRPLHCAPVLELDRDHGASTEGPQHRTAGRLTHPLADGCLRTESRPWMTSEVSVEG
jgi:hypothetical protein